MICAILCVIVCAIVCFVAGIVCVIVYFLVIQCFSRICLSGSGLHQKSGLRGKGSRCSRAAAVAVELLKWCWRVNASSSPPSSQVKLPSS